MRRATRWRLGGIEVLKPLVGGRKTESASGNRLAKKGWSVFRFGSFLVGKKFKLWRWIALDRRFNLSWRRKSWWTENSGSGSMRGCSGGGSLR
ncbi:hypothetical protein RO3G_01394 [Rhizopus delemar RA 99-880]|uniref:Uncharacterized protein n=1 Tax=Rhizopus delemar (strain RA 99-880 / ATCC MYA-4621 / FGSC 9543 / NRRL 43880) TaxID=246409 RepID=I1BKG0_RHIO9|nr:hypothetical protein RO3G_01394 [Rhizopus delemar RA 99-880]|eukprot:EIE76690.1 hypothetical protein RO3G_01394 [Rhizopus delemar RA 99-880]